MKTLCFTFLIIATLSSVMAQEPNQTCVGRSDLHYSSSNIGRYHLMIQTYLYIGEKINKTWAKAKLMIVIERKNTRNEEVKEVFGFITRSPDLTGNYMFKNQDDSLRYLSSGYMYDSLSYDLRMKLSCDKLIF